MYHKLSDMFLIHIKTLRVFKREHENNMINVHTLEKDAVTHKGNVNQYMNSLKKTKKIEKLVNPLHETSIIVDTYYNLQPLFITLDCLRLAFVRSYEWEEKENLFLIEYRKLKAKDNNVNLSQMEVRTDVETIMETLPIHIRIETIIRRLNIGIIDDKKRNFKRNIYPQNSSIQIDLPFLSPTLSIKHLYLLQ